MTEDFAGAFPEWSGFEIQSDSSHEIILSGWLMFKNRGKILKRSEILPILGAGMTSVAENADRIAEVTFWISWLSPGSSKSLITSGRSHLSCRRIQLQFPRRRHRPLEERHCT